VETQSPKNSKIMKSYTPLSLFVLSMSIPANAALVNYVITGYASTSAPIVETGVGGTTDVSGANASGGPTNTVLRTAGSGTFVDFTIGNADAIVGDKFLAANINALPTIATLRVTLQAISAGGSEIMIARTSDSQGLQDIGTVTLLLAGANGSNANTQSNSATFGFDWRNANNDGPLVGSNQIIFSSYDIDFTQRNRISSSDYAVIGTSTSPVSNLSTSTTLGTTTIVDPAPGTSSVITEPKNAYAFVTVAGDTSQSISVDKAGGGVAADGFGSGGNQLYMFSFRSPSPLLPSVPEPSSAIIACLGALTMLRRQRN
jgi:hypothetical protein